MVTVENAEGELFGEAGVGQALPGRYIRPEVSPPVDNLLEVLSLQHVPDHL